MKILIKIIKLIYWHSPPKQFYNFLKSIKFNFLHFLILPLFLNFLIKFQLDFVIRIHFVFADLVVLLDPLWRGGVEVLQIPDVDVVEEEDL